MANPLIQYIENAAQLAKAMKPEKRVAYMQSVADRIPAIAEEFYVDLGDQDEKGRTALMVACEYHLPSVVQALYAYSDSFYWGGDLKTDTVDASGENAYVKAIKVRDDNEAKQANEDAEAARDVIKIFHTRYSTYYAANTETQNKLISAALSCGNLWYLVNHVSRKDYFTMENIDALMEAVLAAEVTLYSEQLSYWLDKIAGALPSVLQDNERLLRYAKKAYLLDKTGERFEVFCRLLAEKPDAAAFDFSQIFSEKINAMLQADDVAALQALWELLSRNMTSHVGFWKSVVVLFVRLLHSALLQAITDVNETRMRSLIQFARKNKLELIATEFFNTVKIKITEALFASDDQARVKLVHIIEEANLKDVFASALYEFAKAGNFAKAEAAARVCYEYQVNDKCSKAAPLITEALQKACDAGEAAAVLAIMKIMPTMIWNDKCIRPVKETFQNFYVREILLALELCYKAKNSKDVTVIANQLKKLKSKDRELLIGLFEFQTKAKHNLQDAMSELRREKEEKISASPSAVDKSLATQIPSNKGKSYNLSEMLDDELVFALSKSNNAIELAKKLLEVKLDIYEPVNLPYVKLALDKKIHDFYCKNKLYVKDANGRDALSYAAKSGNTLLVDELLQYNDFNYERALIQAVTFEDDGSRTVPIVERRREVISKIYTAAFFGGVRELMLSLSIDLEKIAIAAHQKKNFRALMVYFADTQYCRDNRFAILKEAISLSRAAFILWLPECLIISKEDEEKLIIQLAACKEAVGSSCERYLVPSLLRTHSKEAKAFLEHLYRLGVADKNKEFLEFFAKELVPNIQEPAPAISPHVRLSLLPPPSNRVGEIKQEEHKEEVTLGSSPASTGN